VSEWWMWLVFLFVAVGGFALVEGLALKHPTQQYTLSRCIAYLGENFPLSIWICGIFAGAMAVHFFWHYCPFGASSG
jgi:hypothetical protein